MKYNTPHNGKRTSRQVGDKAAAETVASKIRAKLQLGDFGFDEKKKPIPLFKGFAKGFMGTYSAINHKESTQEGYQQALDRHILPYFGDMSLDEISRKDIQNLIAEKQQQRVASGKGDAKKKKRLSAGTIRILKAYLSAILSEAVDDEIIGFNPAARTGKLIKSKDGKKEIFPYTWEEKCHLEKAVLQHYPRYYPLILTALRTGMQLGELIALQPGNLDFNGGFIEIRINNLRKQVFYKCLEKAGLRRIRIHDLRNTYTTLRISKGDNILDLSKQLGHHSVKITLDTYTHWMPGGKKFLLPNAPYMHPDDESK